MDKLITEFGNATLNNSGYYRITTKKEGFNGQLLHRLIMAKQLGCGIPSNYSVHHINENPLDNRVENLELLKREEHIRLHLVGQKQSDIHKRNHSLAISNSGIRNVIKVNDNTCKQGFYWTYRWRDGDKRHSLSSVDLKRLEQRVKERNLPWEVFDKGDV